LHERRENKEKKNGEGATCKERKGSNRIKKGFDTKKERKS